MERIIKSVSKEELTPSLDFVEKVFTDSENATEARIVRNLVAEIFCPRKCRTSRS